MALAVAGAVGLSEGGVVAASAPPTGAERPGEAQADGALVVDLSVGDSRFEPAAVRAAIARELGVLVVEPSASRQAQPKLEVRFEGPERAVLSFRTPDGRSVGRGIDLPRQPDRAVETIALLAANLVRNEAADLVSELERRARAAARTEREARQPPQSRAQPEASPPPAPVAPKHEPPGSEPTDDDLLGRHPINLSLFHPVALYPDSDRREFKLELGLLYGRVRAVDGVGINAMVARVDQEVYGAQLAGIGSWVGGDSVGVQAAGLGVLSEGCSHGVHLSGLVNLEFGRGGTRSGREPCPRTALVGAQITGGYNSVVGDLSGSQTSGGANTVIGNLDGLQVSGAVNIVTGSVRGAQLSSVNVASGSLVGAHVDVVNVVGSADSGSSSQGAEIGVANVDGSDLDGLQVGVVNVSGRQRGAQIGLVNVSEHLDGVPIGLVNVGGNTVTSLLAFSTSRTPVNLGVKFLTGHLFSTVSGGCDSESFLEAPCQRVLQGVWTLGGHLPVAEPFALEPAIGYAYEADVDRPGESVNRGHVVLYRAALSWQPLESLGLFAGAGARQLIDDQGSVTLQGEVLGGVQAF
jgi:hypothetical protein